MVKRGSIPLFGSIGDLHHAMNSALEPVLEGFHIYRAEEILSTVRQSMPAYRKNFHLLTLVVEADYTVTVNGQAHRLRNCDLIFSSQGQVVSWERTGNWYGYTVFFSPEFLAAGSYNPVFLRDFPFFQLDANVVLHLNAAQQQELVGLLERMLYEQQTYQPHRLEVLQACLQLVLALAARWHQAAAQQTAPPVLSAASARARELTQQFQHLLASQPLRCHQLAPYAEALRVSPRYLSEAVKAAAGRPALQLLQDVLLLEARALLRQTTLSVKQIAHELRFVDSSHFNRFLRDRTGQSASQLRQP